MNKVQKRQTFMQIAQIEDEERKEEQLADIDVAKEYRKNNMVWDIDNDKEFGLFCELNELSDYGTGLRLFFEFIKYSAIVFLLMFLISVPSIYKNGEGGSVDDLAFNVNLLSRISLSNQSLLTIKDIPNNASNTDIQTIKSYNDDQIGKFIDDSSIRLLWVTIPDIVYSALFLLFIIWFNYYSKSLVKKIEQNVCYPSTYAINVSGFPDSVIDSKLISAHFKEHFNATIFECNLTRNYENTLFLHQEEAELIDQIKSEKARLRIKNKEPEKQLSSRLLKLQKKLEDLNLKILGIVKQKFSKKLGNENIMLQHNEYPSLSAYIIFENMVDKRNVLNEVKQIPWIGCCGEYPKRLVFEYQGQHYPLKINFKPDEPSNLKWENLEVSSINRFFRSSLSVFLVFIVMILTFLIIILANIVKPENTTNCNSKTYTYQSAISDSSQVNCYCSKLSFKQVTEDKDIQNLCWDTWAQYAYTYALTIVTAFVIMIVNFIIQKIIESLAQFNRYHTVTKQITSTVTKIFIALFINTAIITSILQADIFNVRPAIYISEPIPPLKQLQEEKKQTFSADFDRQWYNTVGTKITTTMFFFILTHLTFQFLLLPLQECLRASRAKSLHGKDIQKAINKAILGPEFNIVTYYALVMNVIFTCLFYSSGMPVLLLVGFITLAIQYWIYKYRLLRICKRPPTYDDDLNKRIIQILPFSLIFHLLIGIYMYGNPSIFPRNKTQINLEYTSKQINGDTTYTSSLYISEDRVIRERAFNILYLFILLIIVVGIVTINMLFGNLFGWIFSKCCDDQKVHATKIVKQYSDEQPDIKKRMIASYNIRENLYYRYIVQAIDIEKQTDTIHSPKNKEKQ